LLTILLDQIVLSFRNYVQVIFYKGATGNLLKKVTKNTHL